MLLAIDVGNTNIVFGIYESNEQKCYFRMSTDKQKSSDEIGLFMLQFLNAEGISPKNIDGVIIASVVPPIMHALNNAIMKYIGHKPVVVGQGVKTGINIRVDNPREVGADRIVNAVAAYEKYGGPLIIVDFGTATTFCAVSAEGDYLGGVIAPGMRISMDALFEHAAKLPRIEIVKPKAVIGKNTVSSMQSGAVYGFVGQVDFIVGKMRGELGAKDCKVIATGGLSKLIAPESSTITHVDKMLTLEGLLIIYKRISQTI